MMHLDGLKQTGRDYRVDAVANYAVVLVSGLVSLCLLPVYARWLGEHAWGLLSLCMLVQSVVLILDMGLSQTMPRDVAQAGGHRDRARDVFGEYLRAYIGLGVFVSIAGALLVNTIAPLWFNTSLEDASTLPAFSLAVIAGAIQLVNGVCVGYWNGSQQQALSAQRTAFFLLVRSAVIVATLLWVDRSVNAFMLCCVSCYLLELMSNLLRLRRSMGSLGYADASLRSGMRLLVRNRGIAISVLLGALVSQLDRIVLSGVIPSATFGIYALVLSLGLAFMQLQYPLMTALYPRVALDRQQRLLPGNLVKMALVCALPCLVAATLAPWLIPAYLARDPLPASAVCTFRWIVAAVGLNAIYHVFYQYMVVAAAGRWLIGTNLLAMLWVALVTWTQGAAWGMESGGVAWFGAAGVQLLSGLMWWAYDRKRRGSPG
jgi:O-antigen/teichoic acid export membrane protein